MTADEWFAVAVQVKGEVMRIDDTPYYLHECIEGLTLEQVREAIRKAAQLGRVNG